MTFGSLALPAVLVVVMVAGGVLQATGPRDLGAILLLVGLAGVVLFVPAQRRSEDQ